MDFLRHIGHLLSLVVVIGMAGCAPAAPENPTWAADVAPILAANCVRCHSVPAIGGAPSGFRLDSYEDRIDDESGRTIIGAANMAGYIRSRVANEERPMPPRFVMYPHTVEVLQNWSGARGEPRPGNRAPEFILRQDLDDSVMGDAMLVQYDIRDPDGDIVLGDLRAVNTSISGDEGVIISRGLHSGRGEVLWDLGVMAPGEYRLDADLDDGNGTMTVPVGGSTTTYTIDDDGNTAPTVRVLRPAPDELVALAESPTYDIKVQIDDPDAAEDQWTLSVTAHLGDIGVNIVDNQAAALGENTVTWNLADDQFPQGLNWRLEVTVSDGNGDADERTVDSKEFILGKVAAAEAQTYQNQAIQNIFGSCGGCHSGVDSPAAANLDYDFGSYDQAASGDALAIYELRGLIYRRVIQERTMPPVTGGGALDEASLDTLRTWLLAGAPQ